MMYIYTYEIVTAYVDKNFKGHIFLLNLDLVIFWFSESVIIIITSFSTKISYMTIIIRMNITILHSIKVSKAKTHKN